MSDEPKFTPDRGPLCPVCGGKAVRGVGNYYSCSNFECGMFGPHPDPTGAKWNAMPRQSEIEELAKDRYAEQVKAERAIAERDELRREVERLRGNSPESPDSSHPSPELIAKGIPKDAVRVTSGRIEPGDWVVFHDGDVRKFEYAGANINAFIEAGSHSDPNQSAVYRVPKVASDAVKEAKVDPAKTYRTRDGWAFELWRILDKPMNDGTQVFGMVSHEDGRKVPLSWKIDGTYFGYENLDLIECKPRVKGWVVFFNFPYTSSVVLYKKPNADDLKGAIACVEIDVEEGHGIGASNA